MGRQEIDKCMYNIAKRGNKYKKLYSFIKSMWLKGHNVNKSFLNKQKTNKNKQLITITADILNIMKSINMEYGLNSKINIGILNRRTHIRNITAVKYARISTNNKIHI